MEFVRVRSTTTVHVVDTAKDGVPPPPLDEILRTAEERAVWQITQMSVWTLCGRYYPTADGSAARVVEFWDEELCGRCVQIVNRRAVANPDLIEELFDPERAALPAKSGRNRMTTDQQYLDVKGVADALGVKPGTIHTYRLRGGFPEPDNRFGNSPVWLPETIEAWKTTRPGQGKGGGRPPKAKADA